MDGWVAEMTSKRDDIKRAEQSGDHVLVAKLQDEYAELECMDACVRILNDYRSLDRYEEIAKRAEHISPRFSNLLMVSVKKFRSLGERRKPNTYEEELRAIRERIDRADERELAKLQKEYAELECLDACLKMMRDRGPLDQYEEIARRNEHISPWYSNHLLGGVKKKRQLLLELEKV